MLKTVDSVRKNLVRILKKILGIPLKESLDKEDFLKAFRLRFGKHFYKKKINASDIVDAMVRLGMREGSNVFIHSNWSEFYNYIGTENNLIDAILRVIGKEGTLVMPAFPLIRKGKLFDVRKSVTAAGMIAETFRHYPDVKRSINVYHSVCALGPNSSFLTAEHHLGQNRFDEKSPYYKLSQVNALVFTLGLGEYWIGTMCHCVEGVLWKTFPYFANFFNNHSNVFRYIDYDGVVKEYLSYDCGSSKKVVRKFFYGKRIYKNYFDPSCHSALRVSNLVVSVYSAAYVIPRLIELGKKGITIYRKPSTKGYKFE
jgi:aminoglycoside 3-N-acetyltransferase